MKTERIIGLLVFLGIFTSAMYFFYPSEYDSIKNNSNLSDESPLDTDSVNSSIQNNNQFKNFDESYFDFFVYRAHILSSKKNANNLKDKINNGGLPAFVEPFGDNQELFAIYVGPFQTEDDIVNNMKLIQELSESKKGEISRWKF